MIHILPTTLPLSLSVYARKKRKTCDEKKYERMTCTSKNSVIITCLLPEQGNNSSLLRKDVQKKQNTVYKIYGSF